MYKQIYGRDKKPGMILIGLSAGLLSVVCLLIAYFWLPYYILYYELAYYSGLIGTSIIMCLYL